MEIERKFLVHTLPDITSIQPVRYERYFLKIEDYYQERIQRRGDIYEIEIKKLVPSTGKIAQYEKTKKSISKEEFEKLKEGKDSMGIIRDGYILSKKPDISIKIYHGKFEGLIRAEVEFENEDEANSYKPETWMSEEITNSPLGVDSKLLLLSREEFVGMINL